MLIDQCQAEEKRSKPGAGQPRSKGENTSVALGFQEVVMVSGYEGNSTLTG